MNCKQELEATHCLLKRTADETEHKQTQKILNKDHDTKKRGRFKNHLKKTESLNDLEILLTDQFLFFLNLLVGVQKDKLINIGLAGKQNLVRYEANSDNHSIMSFEVDLLDKDDDWLPHGCKPS